MNKKEEYVSSKQNFLLGWKIRKEDFLEQETRHLRSKHQGNIITTQVHTDSMDSTSLNTFLLTFLTSSTYQSVEYFYMQMSKPRI